MCDDNEVKNMNIEEAITSRYSARLLKKDQPIAKADLKKIVKLAQSAPSWWTRNHGKYILRPEKLWIR